MRIRSQSPETSFWNTVAEVAAKNASAGAWSAGNRKYVSFSRMRTAFSAVISTPSTFTPPVTERMSASTTGSSETTPSTANPSWATTLDWNSCAAVAKFGVRVKFCDEMANSGS